jgi:pyridinium-3,5-bisthiocarboxylic acid mononucleotide nickel chelatase
VSPAPTVAWFHCFSGIAGDMALGALVDAGAGLDAIRRYLGLLRVDGWSLEAVPVLRCGIAATHVRVTAEETGAVRTAADILALVADAGLPPRVTARASRTFELLAEAEGRLHRMPPAEVHFHEVGGIDAIVDVVGTCVALELLGVTSVFASPVAVGMGMIRAAHGRLPNPPPAVVELLRGAPTYGVDVPLELTTPTGAALLAANVSGWGPLPRLDALTSTGFGAGSREIDGQPNATQVVLGVPAARPGVSASVGAGDEGAGQPVMLVEANVDDVTGEVLAHTVAALLAAGAHDAWVTPIVMKKGRPAHTVSALADVAWAGEVAATLTRETGTLGVRAATLQRWPSARRMTTVEVGGRPVRVKVGPERVKAEYDDAAAAARDLGRPVRDVLAEAEALARAASAKAADDEAAPDTLPPANGTVGLNLASPGEPHRHGDGHTHTH